jgi:hypothetical protein
MFGKQRNSGGNDYFLPRKMGLKPRRERRLSSAFSIFYDEYAIIKTGEK